jgi:hypothetical protein
MYICNSTIADHFVLMPLQSSSSQPSSAGKFSNLSIIKEGAGQVSEPNRLSEELVRCLVAIYCKLTKSSSSLTASRGSQGSRSGARNRASNEPLTDIYQIYKDNELHDIGAYRNAQEITAETIDSNGTGSTAALYKKLRYKVTGCVRHM